MLRLAVALVFVLSVVGCSRPSAPGGAGGPPASGNAPAVNRNLAYEHSVSIETGDDKVGPLFDAVQKACREAVEDSCTILSANIARGEDSYASLRFRAKTPGISRLIAVLSSQGEISGQSTTAEDLSGPIEDNVRRLSMLTAYRGQLEVLRSRNSNDLEMLMRLSRELADVQSQIESLTGSQTQLTRRVETEILNVSIATQAGRAFWKPAGNALSGFAGNLSEALALVITLLAYLLPWALVALLAIWVTQVWRRRARRREAA